MFKNYLVIAWRNLFRNKMYSFINIAGLAIGISSCMIIYLYVERELKYDRHNEKMDSIYRLTLDVHQSTGDIQSAATAPLMGPLIQENFPEIEKMVRLSLPFERLLSYNGKKSFDNKIMTSDSTFFDVFTLPLLEGDSKTALNSPNKIVLTESSAKKLFGNSPALGQNILFQNEINMLVSGVVKDVPESSHFKFDALLSRTSKLDTSVANQARRDGNEENWYWIFQYTYFLVKPGSDINALESKISSLTEKQFPERRKESSIYYNGKLQPLKNIHLKSNMDREILPNSDIKYIYIFSATAIIVLLIACFNFINLSTARSVNRSKEIGLRKVVGSERHQLIQQFLGESFLYTLIAVIFSIALVYFSLPLISSFTTSSLAFSSTILFAYLAIILFVSLLSGLYPAFLISSFKPIKALKGQVNYSWQDLIFRKGLVIIQFTIAIVLIIGTCVILQQLNFVQNRKMGIQKEQMLQLSFKKTPVEKQELFLNTLLKNPKVISASLNSFNFKDIPAIPMVYEGDPHEGFNAQNVILIDENFIKNFQLNLVSGRNVSKDFPQDEQESFLVNETAVKSFGWENPERALGKTINWAGEKQGKVIGVVKDFNYRSLHEDIKPLIMHIFPMMRHSISIRIQNEQIASTLQDVETTWKEFFADSPFKYSFMQEDYEKMYGNEQKLSQLLSIFTFLSVFVACLGLFGLATFSIKQRTREIGIRKILGASIYSITSLVSKDFLKLVLVSVFVSFPIAWLAMNKWLSDFAYRVELTPLIFVFAGVMAIAIAFLTISLQALKSARQNPIKTIRTE